MIAVSCNNRIAGKMHFWGLAYRLPPSIVHGSDYIGVGVGEFLSVTLQVVFKGNQKSVLRSGSLNKAGGMMGELNTFSIGRFSHDPSGSSNRIRRIPYCPNYPDGIPNFPKH